MAAWQDRSGQALRGMLEGVPTGRRSHQDPPKGAAAVEKDMYIVLVGTSNRQRDRRENSKIFYCLSDLKKKKKTF